MRDGKGNHLSETVIFNRLVISATPYTSKRKALYNQTDMPTILRATNELQFLPTVTQHTFFAFTEGHREA